VISELARAPLTRDAGSDKPAKSRFGFRPFPKRARIVTNETVDSLRDEDAY